MVDIGRDFILLLRAGDGDIWDVLLVLLGTSGTRSAWVQRMTVAGGFWLSDWGFFLQGELRRFGDCFFFFFFL